jgi:hypothetical protein
MYYINRSDILSILHRELGLQIISDHYSRWDYYFDFSSQELSAKQAIDILLSKPKIGSNWGWDGSFLYARVKDIAVADAVEIPNRLIRPWQAAFKKQGYLGLNELAGIALLTEVQRDFVVANKERLDLERNDAEGWIDFNSPTIRVYALLSNKQRKQLFETGVPVGSLSQDQINALAALFSPGSSMSHPVVGIYKDAIRIDKPEWVFSSLGWDPTLIGMHGGEITNNFRYKSENITYGLNAKTIEEAREEIKHNVPQPKDDNFIRGQEIIYQLSILSGNDQKMEFTITIPVPTDSSKDNGS